MRSEGPRSISTPAPANWSPATGPSPLPTWPPPPKKRRDRLIRLAERQPKWVLGCGAAVWWRRVAALDLPGWQTDDAPLRLVAQEHPTADPAPTALAGYGLLARMRATAGGDPTEQLLVRFVDGHPVSAVTIDFLQWCSDRLATAGKTALLLIWDNAAWHVSKAVRTWLREHNRQVNQGQSGVQIVMCLLPSKSPWLNAIEPKLQTLLRRWTALVIAHRLSTIRDADQVLVLERGRIVERGTHAALLAQGGVYAELYRRQFRDAEPALGR